jgi:hypothetical protein
MQPTRPSLSYLLHNLSASWPKTQMQSRTTSWQRCQWHFEQLKCYHNRCHSNVTDFNTCKWRYFWNQLSTIHDGLPCLASMFANSIHGGPSFFSLYLFREKTCEQSTVIRDSRQLKLNLFIVFDALEWCLPIQVGIYKRFQHLIYPLLVVWRFSDAESY